MVRVILERTFKTPLPVPMDPHRWDEMHLALDGCLHLRSVVWVRSYIAKDGRRALCEFEAPYADTVREACRETGVAFDAVWRAEIWPGSYPNGLTPEHAPVLVETLFEAPLTPERWESISQIAQPCLQEHDVQRFWSLVYPDWQRTICIFEATSAEAVRMAYRKMGIAFGQVWRSQVVAPPDGV